MEGFDLMNLLSPEHWLAMDENGKWYLSVDKPRRGGFHWFSDYFCVLERRFFNLPKCENWEDSLIQVKDLIKD